MFEVDKKWYEAAKVRKSRRRYIDKKVEQEKRDSLHKLVDEINALGNGVRLVYKEENSDSIFKGIIGSYGKIQNAPSYIAFIGAESDKNIEEKIGYLGEAFVLQATALGLGTCWISGSYSPDIVRDRVGLKEGEKIYCVSPVGYTPEDKKLTERLMGMIGAKRKNISELCEGLDYDKCPKWIKSALELARIAPSAINRQPWAFRAEDNSIIVSMDNGKDNLAISKRLDCGIAMMHIEVGALYEGVKGEWEYLCNPDVAIFKANK